MSSTRLDSRIPEKGFARPDDALDAFLGWCADQGLELYPHQEEAVLEIFAGNHVVLDTPTGSGKSLVALALHFKTLAECGKSFYTAPIKALVSEKFFSLCEVLGPEHVGMMTGDGTVNRDAPIICCTAEILASMALREGRDAHVDSVVMDEFHYYADRSRGMAWQVPLLVLDRAVFLLMSATLGNTKAIREDLEARTERPVAEVVSTERPIPLAFSYAMQPVHETLHRLVGEAKAPVYVVHFTQREATEQAQALMSTDYATKDEKRAIIAAMGEFRFDSPFGPTLRRYLAHGVGLHHAGLLPKYRRLVERLAQQGLLKLICGTDTLGVGINVPIRTVLFTKLCKYDGRKTDTLTVRDFQQIAGRAGRAGHDVEGFVVAQAPDHIIANARIDAKVRQGKKKKKVVKQKPPSFGYKHWDEQTFERLSTNRPEPLDSRFSVDHGRLLAAMQHADETTGDARDGVESLLALIEESHETRARKAYHTEEVDRLLGELVDAGVVRGDPADADVALTLAEDLQHDFSLHHGLSLFLLEALSALEKDNPDYALDVVSLVESILEDPRAVLHQQKQKAKGEVVARLKAEGVPYEERMEILEQVSWPAPQAEWIEPIYEAYAKTHPWVLGSPVRPKFVVRPMLAELTTFAEVVRDLRLERSEGVLLRYLTDVYKALVQNVPAEARTEGLDDVTAWLRAVLARTDASLVTEWEAMVAGADAPADGPQPATPLKVDISVDPTRFRRRVRAELHGLVRALAHQDWEEAAQGVRARDLDGDGHDDAWDAERIRAAVEPLTADGPVAFDHRARLGSHTVLVEEARHLWRFEQRLLRVGHDAVDPDAWHPDADAPEEDDAVLGVLVGRIDLRDDTNPDGPILELTDLSA